MPSEAVAVISVANPIGIAILPMIGATHSWTTKRGRIALIALFPVA